MAANDQPVTPADAQGKRDPATPQQRRQQTGVREALKGASNLISREFQLKSRHTIGTQPRNATWMPVDPPLNAPPSPLRV
jgi:hypothetical protein